jgi:hypothetical protein
VVDDPAARRLRIGHRLAHGAHPRRRDVAGLEEFLPLVGGPGLEDFGQDDAIMERLAMRYFRPASGRGNGRGVADKSLRCVGGLILEEGSFRGRDVRGAWNDGC